MVTLLHPVPHAAVLARLWTVLLARVQLNVLDRVAQSATSTVTHCQGTSHLDDRYLGDPQLRITAVTVTVLKHDVLHVKYSELARIDYRLCSPRFVRTSYGVWKS